MDDDQRIIEFRNKLEDLLNRSGIDQYCETPDFILADHLIASLQEFRLRVKLRDQWFGHFDV